MRYLGWGTVAGLGMAGLLAAAQPATAQSGTSSGTSSDRMGSGSSSSDRTTTTTTDRTTTTTTDTDKDKDKAAPSTTGSSTSGSATGSTSSGTMGSSSTAMNDTSQQLTGTVEKFDHAAKELTLANSSKKLKISDDTTVMKDGQAASLTDIQEGDQVRASFSGSGDTLQVSRIEVMSAGTTGTKMHPEKMRPDTTSPSTGSTPSTGPSGSDTSRSPGSGADTGSSGKRY